MANAADNNRQRFPQVAGFVDLLRESGLSPSVMMVEHKSTGEVLGSDPLPARGRDARARQLIESEARLHLRVIRGDRGALVQLVKICGELAALLTQGEQIKLRAEMGRKLSGSLVTPGQSLMGGTFGGSSSC